MKKIALLTCMAMCMTAFATDIRQQITVQIEPSIEATYQLKLELKTNAKDRYEGYNASFRVSNDLSKFLQENKGKLTVEYQNFDQKTREMSAVFSADMPDNIYKSFTQKLPKTVQIIGSNVKGNIKEGVQPEQKLIQEILAQKTRLCTWMACKDANIKEINIINNDVQPLMMAAKVQESSRDIPDVNTFNVSPIHIVADVVFSIQ